MLNSFDISNASDINKNKLRSNKNNSHFVRFKKSNCSSNNSNKIPIQIPQNESIESKIERLKRKKLEYINNNNNLLNLPNDSIEKDLDDKNRTVTIDTESQPVSKKILYFNIISSPSSLANIKSEIEIDNRQLLGTKRKKIIKKPVGVGLDNNHSEMNNNTLNQSTDSVPFVNKIATRSRRNLNSMITNIK